MGQLWRIGEILQKAAPFSQPPLRWRPKVDHAHDFPNGPQEPPLILRFDGDAGRPWSNRRLEKWPESWRITVPSMMAVGETLAHPSTYISLRRADVLFAHTD